MSLQKKITDLPAVPSLNGSEAFEVAKSGSSMQVLLSAIFTYFRTLDFSLLGHFTMTVGKSFTIRSGTNQRAGSATLSAGTATIGNTTVSAANSLLILSRKTISGTPGHLSYTLSDGVGFTINSSSGTDASIVSYFIIEVV